MTNTDTEKTVIQRVIDARDALEENDWRVNVDGDEIELFWNTPAGEDFSVYIDDDTDLFGVAQDFDEDEHVTNWLDAKASGVGGVPSARELVEDADAIHDKLWELYNIVYNVGV